MAPLYLPPSTDRLLSRVDPLRSFWAMATDVISPQDALALAEDLGIELDTHEHIALEKGPLCSNATVLGKRRR